LTSLQLSVLCCKNESVLGAHGSLAFFSVSFCLIIITSTDPKTAPILDQAPSKKFTSRSPTASETKISHDHSRVVEECTAANINNQLVDEYVKQDLASK